VALKREAGDQFVGDELAIGWPLQRQEALEETVDVGRPVGAVISA